MYVAEVKSKKKGKSYLTTLIRESYRKGDQVKNNTVANISNLPSNLINNIKLFLKGVEGDFRVSDLENGHSYEYGASFALRELAKNIGLDKAIFSRKTPWRENVLTMIIGRFFYQISNIRLWYFALSAKTLRTRRCVVLVPKRDDRVRAHIFIIMLAYYLQWHVMQRVEPLFASDGKGADRRWSFEIIIKRLKSINKVENLIKAVVIKKGITKLDQEQNEILKLLGVKL